MLIQSFLGRSAFGNVTLGHIYSALYVILVMYAILQSCTLGERSGSVVECLTRDRRAAGLSLTGVTVLWSLSKTHLS